MSRRLAAGALFLACSLAPSSPGAAAPGGSLTVTGRVEDSAGRPLPGAVLRLYPLLGLRETAELHLAGKLPTAALETVAGAAGEYHLAVPQAGLWRLVVSARGRAPRERVLSPVVEAVRLPAVALAAEAPATVRVVDPTGQPVAGAVVLALPAERDLRGETWTLPAARLVTDATGIAVVPRAAADRVDLWAAAPGHAAAAARGVPGSSHRLALGGGTPRALNVVGTDGRPASGVLAVTAGEGLPLGRTSATGAVTLTAAPGDSLAVWLEDAGGAAARTAVAPPPPGERAPAQRVALAAPVRLAGRVIDAVSRRAVAGAVVWLAGRAEGYATSDATGGYTLAHPPGEAPGILRAAAAGHFPAFLPWRAPFGTRAAAPTVALDPATSLAGTVSDPQGRPVEGVDVTAEVGGGPRGRRGGGPFGDETAPRARTDAAGRFRLAPLAGDAAYRVSFRRQGYAPLEQAVPPGADERVPDLHVTLRAGVRASGVVLDGARQPVPGATVELVRQESPGPRNRFFQRAAAPPAGQVQTDGSGRFAIADLAAGRYLLTVEATGFAPTTVPGVEIADAGADLDVGTVTLLPGVAVEGRVLDPQGQPVAGAEVFALANPAPLGALRWVLADLAADATTGADGFFRLVDRRPGEKVDVAVRHGRFTPGRLAGVAAPTSEPVTITLEAAVELRGRVVDERNDPLADATVVVMTERAGGGLSFSGLSGSARTDTAGRFTVEGIDPGPVRIVVNAAGYLELQRSGVEVPAGPADAGLELVLRRGASVEGVVTTPDGLPAIGARVQVVAEQRGGPGMRMGGESAFTDGDGRYGLAGVEPGERSIEAQHERHDRAVASLEVRPGENRLDLRLGGGQEVSGRVSGPAGEPVAGAEVGLGPPGQGWAVHTAVTDAAGAFTVSGVPDGSYTVSASHPDHAEGRAPEAITVAGAPVAGVVVELPAGGAIAGALTGLPFVDLPRVRVIAFQPGLGWKQGSVGYDGRYRVAGLAPGQWSVTATVEGAGRRAAGTVELAAGQSEGELDLEFGGGVALSGRVRHEGRAVDGALVQARGADVSASGSARTDATGSFRLENLEPGTYDLQIAALDSGLSHHESLALEADREIEIELRAWRIAGSVVDAASGDAVEGVRLTAEPAEGEPGAVTRFGGGVTSDDRGRFSIGVAEGTWRLAAEKPGYAPAEVTVDARGRSVEGVEVRLQPTQGVTLQVARSFGGPPARVMVSVLDAAGRTVVTGGFPTGENGAVRLSTVPAGSWDVLVRADDSGTVRVAALSPGPPVPVVLPPQAMLAVSVPELAGESALARLTVLDDRGRPLQLPGWSRADSSFELRRGQIQLQYLPAGTWTLQATTPDGRTWRGTATTVAGASAAVELR